MNSIANGPPLGVVMRVRNAAPFLDESVRSILNQTFSNFEFVILGLEHHSIFSAQPAIRFEVP